MITRHYQKKYFEQKKTTFKRIPGEDVQKKKKGKQKKDKIIGKSWNDANKNTLIRFYYTEITTSIIERLAAPNSKWCFAPPWFLTLIGKGYNKFKGENRLIL